MGDWSDDPVRSAYEDGVADGEARERKRIVAWLRRDGGRDAVPKQFLADAIERHASPAQPPPTPPITHTTPAEHKPYPPLARAEEARNSGVDPWSGGIVSTAGTSPTEQQARAEVRKIVEDFRSKQAAPPADDGACEKCGSQWFVHDCNGTWRKRGR